jgi:hypothetical protein
VLLLCLASELDPSFQPLFGYVQDNINLSYPTMHLAKVLFSDPSRPQYFWPQAFGPDAPLRRYQLISLRDDQQPLTMQPLSLPERIFSYLNGVNRPDPELSPPLTLVDESMLTESLAQVGTQVLQLAQNVRVKGSFPLVNLIGAEDGGQREVAAATAGALGVHLLSLTLLNSTTALFINLPM